ncbi:hypothetical protein D3C86_1234970 [compost metagenome]
MQISSKLIGTAVRSGWKTFKANALLLVATTIALLVFTFVVEQALDALLGKTGILSLLASMLLGAGLTLGYCSFYIDLLETGKPNIQALFNRLTPAKVLHMVAFSILYGLIVGLGFLFFVIPGVVFSTMFSQGPHLIVDRNLNCLQAMQESAKMTKGAKKDIFLFGWVAAGITLLGLLAFGVGVLAAIAIIGLAYAHIYRQLLHKLDAPGQAAIVSP